MTIEDDNLLMMSDNLKHLALDVMTNAYECGFSRYWADFDSVERGMDDGELITKLSFQEKHDEVTGSGDMHHVGVAQIVDAMQKIAMRQVQCNPALASRIGLMYVAEDYLYGEGGDAESDDVILQVAALGEITYG